MQKIYFAGFRQPNVGELLRHAKYMEEYHKSWASALNVRGKPPKKGMNQAKRSIL